MTIPALRDAAEQIWQAALHAASPDACIRRALQVTADGFTIGGQSFRVDGRLVVIGAGKAGAGMARVVEDLFTDRISDGLVITKYGHRLPTDRIRVLEAGHPIPDRNGILAVEGMRGILRGLESQDLVLCLLSGGASALLPSPADGIDLEEKQSVTSSLLRAGSTIRELNAVRKHLSAIKGGQLLRWIAPARVVSLIMSDVIGDPIDSIASGPTSPDTTTYADALRTVLKYQIAVPPAVQARLERGARGEIEETPKDGDALFSLVSNHVIANNHLLLGAASSRARELGFSTRVLSSEIEGEAREVGRFFAGIERDVGTTQQPIPGPACVLGAGETTVTVRGSGLGGRNQEMALAWAIEMQSSEWPVCFASIATDGTDGPTDAAGGLVDPHTCSRAVEQNLDPNQSLRNNDSFHLLKESGDLITTGPTQTNLGDLQILLAGDGPWDWQSGGR